MEQLELAGNDVPQAFEPVVIAKSPGLVPVMVMPVMVSAALPLLASAATWAPLAVPTVEVNVSTGGVSVAAGAVAAVPVPLKLVVCGEPDALSATESVAAKLVADAGVNVT
jgi:hypothetical protein